VRRPARSEGSRGGRPNVLRPASSSSHFVATGSFAPSTYAISSLWMTVLRGRACSPMDSSLHKIAWQKVAHLSLAIQIFIAEVFYFVSRVALNSETTKKVYDLATTDMVDMSFYCWSCFNVCTRVTRQTLPGTALF
jgi:hypothetical protein